MLSLTNPWVLVGLLILLAGSAAGGAKLGMDHVVAKQAKTEQLIAAVREQAQLGAAEAIAKNRPINQFNKQVVEHEVRTVVDYSKCQHSDDGLRGVNAALENKRAESAGHSVVPGANPSR